MPDRQIDGHEIEQWQGRFTKTFDISEADLEQMRLDKVVVWVVATRAGDSNFKILDSGEVRKVTVYKVEESVPLSGELRDQAITFLQHGGQQGHLSLAPEGYTNPPVDRLVDPATGEVLSPPRLVGQATAEGTAVCEQHGRYFLEDGCDGCAQGWDDRPGADEDSTPVEELAPAPSSPGGAPPPEGTVGHIGGYKDADTERPGAPGVAKFDPEADFGGPGPGDIEVGEREVVGSIYPPGHKGKDKILERAKQAVDL